MIFYKGASCRRFETNTKQTTQPELYRSILILIIIPLIPLTILGIIATDQDLLKVSGLDHFYIEIISVILSFIVAYYCIMRGYSFNDKFTLFLGLGFHAAGMIDLLHALFSIINLGQLTFTAYFIPQTWVAGRIVMGAVVMIALLKFARPSLEKEKVTPRLVALYTIGLAVLAGVITAISISQPFPFVTINFIIKRPYEIISATLFLIAIFSFYKYKIFTINDVFYKAVAVSIIIDIFVNIIISYSSFVFDTAFNISHMLKITSFFILIMGLSYSVVRQYKEKEQISERLQTSEAKFRNLYENSPDLYRTIDMNGIITDCNNTYAKALGFTKKEVIGTSIFAHTPEKYMKKKREAFEAWRITGAIKNHRAWMMRKDATTFPTLISAITIYDKDGGIIGSNTVIKDITEIFDAKEKISKDQIQIQNQLEELQKLTKAKDEFLTMITHELKTPLVPIKGYVDLMISERFGSLSEVQKQKLELIKASTDSMLNLVSDLLDSQKLEQSRLKLDKKRYSLFKIINDVIQKLTPVAEDHGVTIVTDLQDAVPYLCDKSRIEQVMLNLISNAIDFCPKEIGKIQIKLQQKNNAMEIIVKDNGIGITKEELDKIFQRFYQIDTSFTRKHGGTGLGLSVCKGIIENHGGKIWAESDGPNKGTEIHFRLPLKN